MSNKKTSPTTSAPWEKDTKSTVKKPKKPKSSKHSVTAHVGGSSVTLNFASEKELYFGWVTIREKCARGQSAEIIAGDKMYSFIPNLGFTVRDKPEQ